MSYDALEEIRRSFRDESNREWVAERIGRTSGIVAPGKDTPLPGPADILRFFCSSDPSQRARETTIKAGSLGELGTADLQRILSQARVLPNPPDSGSRKL